jgi:N-acetylmuramoyl-L-alanine amidase
VLRETNCPSILVETAFLSHPEEELLLAQGAFRQRMADAIAIGIMRYFSSA